MTLIYIYVSDIKISVRVLMNQDSRTTTYIIHCISHAAFTPKNADNQRLLPRGSDRFTNMACSIQMWSRRPWSLLPFYL